MIYLDNSATSFPKPDSVYAFMNDFYRHHGVSPGRSGFDAAIAAEEMVFETRRLLTQLFNGTDPNRLTFSYNASDSLNMILQGLAQKGDHVVTTMLEHNSVLRPLHHLAHEGIIEVTYVPFDKDGYVDPDDIAAAIKPNTRMVVVNHCSNVIGTYSLSMKLVKSAATKGYFSSWMPVRVPVPFLLIFRLPRLMCWSSPAINA
jgi:selenocysteine lyase/cysteine desulfurase